MVSPAKKHSVIFPKNALHPKIRREYSTLTDSSNSSSDSANDPTPGSFVRRLAVKARLLQAELYHMTEPPSDTPEFQQSEERIRAMAQAVASRVERGGHLNGFLPLLSTRSHGNHINSPSLWGQSRSQTSQTLLVFPFADSDEQWQRWTSGEEAPPSIDEHVYTSRWNPYDDESSQQFIPRVKRRKLQNGASLTILPAATSAREAPQYNALETSRTSTTPIKHSSPASRVKTQEGSSDTPAMTTETKSIASTSNLPTPPSRYPPLLKAPFFEVAEAKPTGNVDPEKSLGFDVIMHVEFDHSQQNITFDATVDFSKNLLTSTPKQPAPSPPHRSLLHLSPPPPTSSHLAIPNSPPIATLERSQDTDNPDLIPVSPLLAHTSIPRLSSVEREEDELSSSVPTLDELMVQAAKKRAAPRKRKTTFRALEGTPASASKSKGKMNTSMKGKEKEQPLGLGARSRPTTPEADASKMLSTPPPSLSPGQRASQSSQHYQSQAGELNLIPLASLKNKGKGEARDDRLPSTSNSTVIPTLSWKTTIIESAFHEKVTSSLNSRGEGRSGTGGSSPLLAPGAYSSQFDREVEGNIFDISRFLVDDVDERYGD